MSQQTLLLTIMVLISFAAILWIGLRPAERPIAQILDQQCDMQCHTIYSKMGGYLMLVT